MLITLVSIYIPLLAWVMLGFGIQRRLPAAVLQRLGIHRIGRVMYWIGIPLAIIGFLQEVDFDGAIWLSPVVSWGAIGVAMGLAQVAIWGWRWWGWRSVRSEGIWSDPQQGSFRLLAAMGNTGFMGFPICRAVGGPEFFAWAVFYDLMGSLLGTFGLGVWLAQRYGSRGVSSWQALARLPRTPALWALGLGLILNRYGLPTAVEQGVNGFAWAMVPLSLILLGMRLGQAQIGGSVSRAGLALGIKLLLVPCAVGLVLMPLPLPAMGKLILILQAGMPPAISTLVLTEEFELDRDITVTALAVGYGLALVTLPVWVEIWGE